MDKGQWTINSYMPLAEYSLTDSHFKKIYIRIVAFGFDFYASDQSDSALTEYKLIPFSKSDSLA